jgi:predicted small metal-binding protein
VGGRLRPSHAEVDAQIGAHAAEDHGITTITPQILQAVQAKIVATG